ncbi:MAG: transposase, partial [Phycisphaerae bacterium]|nr:transposase [Phycisphaerae bacterium]
PWENGYAESFHSRLRDELLNAELFADVVEARALAARWKNEYNHRRPHSALGYIPPALYAARLEERKEAKPLDCVERGDGATLPSQAHPSTPHPLSAAGWLMRLDTMHRLS